MNPKVSVVILNWNGLEDTLKCLESLLEVGNVNFEVVGNASLDGSVKELVGWTQHYNIHVPKFSESHEQLIDDAHKLQKTNNVRGFSTTL